MLKQIPVWLMICAEGKIVKLSPESIHVVVLGFSAAVITDVDIREEFKYKMVIVCMIDIVLDECTFGYKNRL